MMPLFPLPCDPFDTMMLLDDRPTHPMVCGAEFVFRGTLRQDVLEHALGRALRRHPIIGAQVAPAGFGRYQWLPGTSQVQVHWDLGSTVTRPPSFLPFDLSQEPGLRVFVRVQGETSTLQFEFHHACTDAGGGMAFVEDVFFEYSRMVSPEVPLGELRPLCQGLLKTGRKTSRRMVNWSERLSSLIFEHAKSLDLMCHPPLPLPSPHVRIARTADADLDTPSATHVVCQFDELVSQNLRHYASQSGASLNDVIVRDVFRAMGEWIDRFSPGTSRQRHLRIVLPMNLREREDSALPASNKTGYAFLTRALNSLGDADRLLQGIREETAKIRRFRSPHVTNARIAFLHRLRFALRSMMSERSCFATASISNLGDPSRRFFARFPRSHGRIRIGDLLLEHVMGIAPVRPLTRVTFNVCTYRNRLTIGLRCDPTCFTIGDTELLADRLTSCIHHSADRPVRLRRAA